MRCFQSHPDTPQTRYSEPTNHLIALQPLVHKGNPNRMNGSDSRLLQPLPKERVAQSFDFESWHSQSRLIQDKYDLTRLYHTHPTSPVQNQITVQDLEHHPPEWLHLALYRRSF